MASIENKSRTQVSVKGRDDLTKFFPYNKTAAAGAYIAELKSQGHKPTIEVLDEAYLVRFKVKGKRCSHTYGNAKDALEAQKQLESEQHRGLFVDYTKAHQTPTHELLVRYLREEAPRLKGFLITAYKINSWLEDAGLPRQDIAAIHAAHPNPKEPGLRIPTPTGQRMSAPNSEASAFVLKRFSELAPDDFQDYLDERMEEVEAQTADRELDIVRRVPAWSVASSAGCTPTRPSCGP